MSGQGAHTQNTQTDTQTTPAGNFQSPTPVTQAPTTPNTALQTPRKPFTSLSRSDLYSIHSRVRRTLDMSAL